VPNGKLNNSNIEHVAIIMDGNGRWANDRGLPRSKGHFQGAKVVKDIIKAAPDLGVKVLTIFAFSTENWTRPNYEVNVLMRLFQSEITKQFEELVEEKVQVRFIGSRSRLPDKLVSTMEHLELGTKENLGLVLQIALNYGGRQDILEAVKAISSDIKNGEIDVNALTERHISDRISTSGFKDPDLVIRTSGELRISNFLLWQTAYSEFAFVDKHWPDFTAADLRSILDDVLNRQRRFGGLSPYK
jgi:undecaprenyl diphosphate synthase